MGIIKASKLIFDYIRHDEEEKAVEVDRAIDGLSLDIAKMCIRDRWMQYSRAL